MWWIALHLPDLSLESWTATLGPEDGGPAALLERHRIVAVSPAARALGIVCGMQRATALALAPQLLLGSADAARDAQALCAVAWRMLVYTPSVALDPPCGVLAELQASVRCFGGRARLLQQVQSALQALDHSVHIACAPSAEGASLLARSAAARQAGPVPAAIDAAERWLQQWPVDPASLQRGLDPLPLQLVAADAAQAAALQAMGLSTLADLRRQPRAGLARRCGSGLLDRLDRAYGSAPEPQRWIEWPLRFEARLALEQRAETVEPLRAGAAALLRQLIHWAGARQARVAKFTLLFDHERRLHAAPQGTVQQLDVALAEASADAAHLQALLHERLARFSLAAPVRALSLQCESLVHAPPPNGELFPSAAARGAGLLRLIERLQARLGSAQVQRIAAVADHRPERATAMQPLGAWAPVRGSALAEGSPRITRPAWLLQTPQALHERDAEPWLDGRPLQVLCGPERIEAGWWDGHLVVRDYFIAQCRGGALVWIYRCRPAPTPGAAGWYLHGRFG